MNELGFSDASAFPAHSAVKLEDTFHVCQVKYLWPTKPKEKKRHTKSILWTQINTD